MVKILSILSSQKSNLQNEPIAYDDEISQQRRNYIRSHYESWNNGLYQDIYEKEPRLEEYELNKLVKFYSSKPKKINIDNLNIVARKIDCSPKTTIYRGLNNSLYESEDLAKKSYFAVHDAYYFNGMYFKNKEELQLYLSSEYYGQNGEGFKTKNNAEISILSSNNNHSSSINKNHLIDQGTSNESINAKIEFANFIKTNSNQYLEITMPADGTKYYLSASDINPLNIKNLMSDVDYTKVSSTSGKSSYLIDLSKEDANTLFGPYFTVATDDIQNITNTKSWRKVSNDHWLVAQ